MYIYIYIYTNTYISKIGQRNVKMGPGRRPFPRHAQESVAKTLHIDTGFHWIHKMTAEQRLQFHKALGKEDSADLFIKHLHAQWTSRGAILCMCDVCMHVCVYERVCFFILE